MGVRTKREKVVPINDYRFDTTIIWNGTYWKIIFISLVEW